MKPRKSVKKYFLRLKVRLERDRRKYWIDWCGIPSQHLAPYLGLIRIYFRDTSCISLFSSNLAIIWAQLIFIISAVQLIQLFSSIVYVGYTFIMITSNYQIYLMLNGLFMSYCSPCTHASWIVTTILAMVLIPLRKNKKKCIQKIKII